MLPVIGDFQPWADPSVVQLNRLSMHVPLSGARRRSLDGSWSLEMFEHPDQVPARAAGHAHGHHPTWPTHQPRGGKTVLVQCFQRSPSCVGNTPPSGREDGTHACAVSSEYEGCEHREYSGVPWTTAQHGEVS